MKKWWTIDEKMMKKWWKIDEILMKYWWNIDEKMMKCDDNEKKQSKWAKRKRWEGEHTSNEKIWQELELASKQSQIMCPSVEMAPVISTSSWFAGCLAFLAEILAWNPMQNYRNATRNAMSVVWISLVAWVPSALISGPSA